MTVTEPEPPPTPSEHYDFITPPLEERAAQAAANIAERDAERDANRDPATEAAFAERVDAESSTL